MIVEEARYLDLPDIVFLLGEFAKESHRGPDGFNHDKAYHSLFRMMEDPDIVILVARDGTKIAGISILSIDSVFEIYSQAYFYIFYVHPDFRGTDTARWLVARSVSESLFRGVAHLYVTSTAGFSDGGKNEKLFTNLFKKFGFSTLGTCLHKDLTEIPNKELNEQV